ncbi:MFS family permease [Arthrobacter pascens]|uniref:MFS transporter n=1 Tax=Arthrobacter pascens TaxID=1677 RepID=UPI00278ACCF1|nr:MFS transporter [Arthrobacter pascens]MDQ0635294.1 MFS family permease [Arthrobacter pascens]
MLLAVIFFIGAVGCAIAPNTEFIVAARFVLGLAVGGASATVSVFLSELAASQQQRSPSVNGVRPRSRFPRIGRLDGARALGLDRGGVRYGLLRVGPHYLTLSMYRPIVSSW